MSRIGAAAALTAATLGSAGSTAACPCTGVPGTGSVTTASAPWGASVTTLHAAGLAAFRADGSVSPFEDDEALTASELGLALGFRPIDALELQVSSAFAHRQWRLGAERTEESGVGDTRLAVRSALADAAPPGAAIPWPSLTLAALGRLPTGGRPSTAPALGGLGAPLGAAEVALALELAHQRRHAWGCALVAEAGARFADEVMGVRRQLGPRLSIATVAEAPLARSPELRFGLGVGLDHERPVSVSGRQRPDSATTLAHVSPGLRWFPSEATRVELGWRVTPPWRGWGRNAVAPSTVSAALVLSQ